MGQRCSENNDRARLNRLRSAVCVAVFGSIGEWALTCGQSKELSPHSQHGTQKAFVRGKPEDVSVYDLPAVVSLVQIITAALLLYIVPADEGKMLSPRTLSCTRKAERLRLREIKVFLLELRSLRASVICHKRACKEMIPIQKYFEFNLS